MWNAGSNLAITALYQAFAFCPVSPFHPPPPSPGGGIKGCRKFETARQIGIFRSVVWDGNDRPCGRCNAMHCGENGFPRSLRSLGMTYFSVHSAAKQMQKSSKTSVIANPVRTLGVAIRFPLPIICHPEQSLIAKDPHLKKENPLRLPEI